MDRKKSEESPLILQQGDVLFFQISALPKGVQSVPREERGSVVAEGELTGHAHVVEDESACLYTRQEILYLVVEEEVSCTHEEHRKVRIPAGIYRIGAVQEVDYTAIEERERKEALKVDVPQTSSAPRKEQNKPVKQGINGLLEKRRRATKETRRKEREEREREWRRVRD
jgi:hypothetical protein